MGASKTPTPTPPPQQQHQQQKLTKILSQSYYQQLQSLYLDNCSQWRQVLLYQDWTCVQRLGLMECGIGDDGAEFVGRMCWPHLDRLNLCNNNITALGVKQLLIHQQFTLNNNGISLVDMREMPDYRFSKLSWLILSYNNIRTRGIQLLIKADLKLLNQLHLQKSQVGNEGARQLAKGYWPKLHRLNLRNNNIVLDGWLSVASVQFKDWIQIYTHHQNNNNQKIGILYLQAISWPDLAPCMKSKNLMYDLQIIRKSKQKRAGN